MQKFYAACVVLIVLLLFWIGASLQNQSENGRYHLSPAPDGGFIFRLDSRTGTVKALILEPHSQEFLPLKQMQDLYSIDDWQRLYDAGFSMREILSSIEKGHLKKKIAENVPDLDSLNLTKPGSPKK